MGQNHSKYIVTGVIAVIVLLLGWRIYWSCPTTIKGTGPISKLVVRPDSVSITLNRGVRIGQVVDLKVFERLTFEASGYDVEETLGSSDTWEREGEASYNEYIRPMGRLRFYEAPEYGEEGGVIGIVNWVVAIPNELFADHFFSRHIARHLDLSRQSQKVYIPAPAEHCYLTVHLDGTRVSRIAWLPYHH